jgi:DNA polymerase-3 subunit epsilon
MSLISSPSPNLLLEVFKKIQEKFPGILLTGSLSMAVQGFKIRRVPKDLDIIIFDDFILRSITRQIPDFELVPFEDFSELYDPDGIRFPVKILYKEFTLSIDFFLYDESLYDQYFFTTVNNIPCAKYSHPFQFKIEYALKKDSASSKKHREDILFFLDNNSTDRELRTHTNAERTEANLPTLQISKFIQKDVVFFDLETTGTDTSKDRIIEIYAKRLTSFGEVSEYYTKINPEMDINPEASKVHGIYMEDLVSEPTFRDVASTIFDFFEGAEVSGYNIKHFDIPIINRQLLETLLRTPFELNQTYLDCYAIIQQFEPRKLENMYFKYTNKVLFNAHSAESDVNATIELFAQILSRNSSWTYQELRESLMEKNKVLDFDRKFYEDEEGVVRFNFGKNKGLPIYEHEDYLKWMQGQDFSPSTKEVITNFFKRKAEIIKSVLERAKESRPKVDVAPIESNPVERRKPLLPNLPNNTNVNLSRGSDVIPEDEDDFLPF